MIAYPLCHGVRLSKIRGGRLLTGIGADGGAEDRMGLCAFRHHIGWRLNVRLCGRRGLLGLVGLRTLGVLLAALLLRLLHVFDGGAEGALQLRVVWQHSPT